MTPHPGRRRALKEALAAADLEGAILTHRPSVRYLCGFTGSSGALWISRTGAPALVTDFRYEEQAAEEVSGEVRVHVSRDGWVKGLAAVLQEMEARVAFEPEHLTVADHEGLAEALPTVELEGVPNLVSAAREVKDASEIEAIREAAALAERALGRTLEAVHWAGRPTERRVAALLEAELRTAGSEPLPFEVIVAAGPRSALPHATPSDRAIETGDLVLVDFGARVAGYCSDMTRTFVVGPAAEWQIDAHANVLEAQRLARDAIAPGVPCADVDAAARDALARADLERYFGHSTGHGIGLEVHEGPSLSWRSEASLVAGNVVTVEPGVYLPARGGVRIEDDVLITEDGVESLTTFPRELQVLGRGE